MPQPPVLKDVPRNLRMYVLCLLTRGERWDETSEEEAASLMPKHLAHLRQHMETGKFAAAGPIMEDDALAGMILIRTESLAEADSLVSMDPAVVSKRLSYKLRPVFLPALDSVRALFHE